MTIAKALDLEAYRRPITGEHLFPYTKDGTHVVREVLTRHIVEADADVIGWAIRKAAQRLVAHAIEQDCATWESFVAIVDRPLLVAWMQSHRSGWHMHPRDMDGFAASEVMRGGVLVYGALTPNPQRESCSKTGICVCTTCSTAYRRSPFAY